MKIAVNLKNLWKANLDETNNFILECINRIAKKQPNHEFVFITDKPFINYSPPSKNIAILIIRPEIKNNILWKLWYNYKLPATLRKIKADVLINTNGICSLRTKTPQCLLVHDMSYLYNTHFVPINIVRFYKKFTLASLTKAKSIISITTSIKKNIVENYRLDEAKIDVTSFGINKLFQPIDEKEKKIFKEKYTDGKEFFLYRGTLHDNNNLINTLKAFSFFKKRQKSNMQFVIIATSVSVNDKFIETLKLYKYRNEVKILEKISSEECAKIMASSYAFIHVPLYDNWPFALPQAMKCKVPVITSDTESMHEICDEAALYADITNHESIADKMMLLFKDENKRNELIENGNIKSQEYNWDKTATLLWQTVINTIQ